MLKLKKSLFVLWTISLFCHSCYGNRTAQGKNDDSIAVDSLCKAEPELKALPAKQLPSAGGIKYSVTVYDSQLSGQLNALESEYVEGARTFTFRGNNLRDADFGGKIKGRPKKITKKWSFETFSDDRPTSTGTWMGGTGWTGQPVYVEWPDSIAAQMKNAPGVSAEFVGKEIIFGSLCSRIYFLNPENGKPTRKWLDAFNVIKGSVSLDPSLNGNLYVGHGVAHEGNPFGCQAYNLHSMQRFFFQARLKGDVRGWNAFDSSPVAAGGFLFWPGENGTLYKFYRAKGKHVLHSALRYTVNGAAPGMESSMAVFSNYGYV